MKVISDLHSQDTCNHCHCFASGEEYRPSWFHGWPLQALETKFQVTVDFCLLTASTMLESASDQWSQSRVELLGLPMLTGGSLAPVCHCHTCVTSVGTSKWCCSLTCFVESKDGDMHRQRPYFYLVY